MQGISELQSPRRRTGCAISSWPSPFFACLKACQNMVFQSISRSIDQSLTHSINQLINRTIDQSNIYAALGFVFRNILDIHRCGISGLAVRLFHGARNQGTKPGRGREPVCHTVDGRRGCRVAHRETGPVRTHSRTQPRRPWTFHRQRLWLTSSFPLFFTKKKIKSHHYVTKD